MNNEFPPFTNEALLETLELWLEPYLQNITTVKELEALDMYTILLGIIPWEKQQLFRYTSSK
jgi:ATP-dependent helicase HrpB